MSETMSEHERREWTAQMTVAADAIKQAMGPFREGGFRIVNQTFGCEIYSQHENGGTCRLILVREDRTAVADPTVDTSDSNVDPREECRRIVDVFSQRYNEQIPPRELKGFTLPNMPPEPFVPEWARGDE